MRFKVSDRTKANKDIKKYGATALISINDPGSRTFQCRLPRHNHFNIYFEDVTDPESYFAPTRADIDRILSWELPDGPILVNCFAGRSRSTAVALGLAYRDGIDLRAAADDIISYRRSIYPNPLIAKYLDDALSADGAIVDIAKQIADEYDARIKGLYKR